MKKISKSAAIKSARENVSMHAIGGQWQVNTYDEECRAWRQGIATDYHHAIRQAGAAKLRHALALLGHEQDAIYRAEYDLENEGGTWTDYVTAP